MVEQARRESAEVSVAPITAAETVAETAAVPDFRALLASLRAAGVGRLDLVRLHFLEALARRTLAHQGNVRHLLEAKLAGALSAFQERLVPAAVEGAQQVTIRPRTAEQSTPLGMLLRQLAQQSTQSVARPQQEHAAPHTALKTLRDSRNIWSTLSVEKQVAKELAQAPKNAGPINSHMLILRSLSLMRAISPDYLNRFMSYAETLLCLDQCENEKSGNVKKQTVVKAVKKTSAITRKHKNAE